MKRLSIILPFVLIIIATASCSNEDEPMIPSDAITLNMMSGDSETTVGGSDVYINTSDNFTSQNCGISDLGRKGSFNDNPNLSQVAQDVAVTPGNYYQIMLAQDIRVIAGSRALPVNTNYYNMYVDSWIYDNDNTTIGAKIRYAECVPTTKALPGWDSTIEIMLENNKYDYSFESGVIIDQNCQIYNSVNSDMGDYLHIDINDNRMTFTNSGWGSGKAEVIAFVRHESLFTRVRFIVQ